MEVKIDKYDKPIVWIDTYVIINMAKSIIDGSINEEEKAKYVGLFGLLRNKVHEEKIICPKGDQHEEIEQGQRLERECHEIENKLSYGVNLIHRSEIEANQQRQMMKAYIEEKGQVIFGCADVFEEDPIEIVRMVKSSGFIVSAFMKTRPKQVEIETQTKLITRDMLEDLRRSNIQDRISFEEQLEDEYQAIVKAGDWAIRNCLSKIQRGLTLTVNDIAQLDIINRPYLEWERLNGRPEGLEGLHEFINSEAFKMIPYIDIHARLCAKVMTGNSIIQTGDAMDINQLSTVLPYCNYIVTDRKMKNRIVELSLHEKYDTKVYYIGDYREIIEQLEAL